MKAVYLGGVRGYQPAVYRPGAGWSTSSSYPRTARGFAVFSHRQSSNACPLTVARRRRLSLRYRLGLLALVVTVVCLLALVLRGGGQL
jgi:hypothetical protein